MLNPPFTKRKTYYKPACDPETPYAGKGYERNTNVYEGTEDKPVNVMSSLCEDGFHRPNLDIDIPCEMIPSSTPGHCHLYFDVPLRWWQYEELLKALANAGIIEVNWVSVSIAERKETLTRLPGANK